MPIRGRYSPFDLIAFNKRLRHSLLLDMTTDPENNDDHDGRYRTEDELASTSTGEGAAFIGIETGSGSPTVDQMQEYLNNTGSSGYFTGGILSDGGSGTINVTAGEGFIRTTANDNAPLQSFTWAAANGIAVTNDTTQYVFVDDTGTINLNTDEFNESVDNIMLGVVTDEGGAISHAFNLGVRLQESIGQMGRYIRHVDDVVRNRRKGGLLFGESGDVNRFVTVTEGQLEWGRTSYPIPTFNTSGADTFDTYSAGGQEATGVSAWPNTHYDDEGVLTELLNNNKWAVLWWYIEPDGHIVMLYGRAQYNTEGQAEDEPEPTENVPNRLSSASVIASKFIFQKGEDVTAKIETAFGTPFTGSGVTAHNNLATLAWTSAGHTGTASKIASFDGDGAAAELAIPLTAANGGTGAADLDALVLVDGSNALAGAWSMGNQATTNVNIDSGAIDGTPVGESSASTGMFTSLEAKTLNVTVRDPTKGFLLVDSGGATRYGPKYGPAGSLGHGTTANVMALANRAVNGIIEIQPNTGAGGAAGETAVARFEDTHVEILGDLEIDGEVGFFGEPGDSQQTVTGSRGGNAALADLLTALATYGLIVDNTTA